MLKKIKDGISPDLRAKAAAARDTRPFLQAMGRSVISLGKRAFTDASLRPIPWKARKDDLPHNLLQKSTTLRKSLRILSVSGSRVVIGSDRAYAAIHQLGGKAGKGKKAKIPARPYLPFYRGKLTARGNVSVNRALQAALRARGI